MPAFGITTQISGLMVPARANSSRNVSMWENLNLTRDFFRGVLVFTYCHVDVGEPVWDGSSLRCQNPLSRLRATRETFPEVNTQPVKCGTSTWMFGAAPRPSDISPHLRSVFHDTAMPDVAFSVVVQRRTLAPGTRATVLVLRINGSLFRATGCLYGPRQLDP